MYLRRSNLFLKKPSIITSMEDAIIFSEVEKTSESQLSIPHHLEIYQWIQTEVPTRDYDTILRVSAPSFE